MTETANERIYREALEKTRDRLDGFEELYANKEVYYAFDELTGIVEKGLSQASKIPVSTDKLSVEKLQEHLLPYSKEMVQKIRDEKMQLVTADEFVKLHKEYLTAIRENGKLQEQLNTAKNELTEISEDVPKPPKYNLNAEFWRTQWSEASGAHLMEYFRAEKLKKDNEILKKALTEISEVKNLTPFKKGFETSKAVSKARDMRNTAKQALAAIGGDDE
ncbi:hypothetical protein [Lactococcus lactis]|uniref:hypothetical protein n=1 Tax=Lactococcus lactis TaxID=1358 RepID=UPI00288FA896|nr:hypothetical protein [Lactococcus lactis]MDT2939226.1 hypothetical protein [Lactococcus lactis]